MGENCFKHFNWQELNFQNIQTIYTTQKKATQLKNGQKTWRDISPKKMYKWPQAHEKNPHHHWLIEKWKSKLLWNTNSHHSEWLPLARQQINSGEGVEKREPSYTAGWNINWYNHYGK